ncbi:short chain dehydrogenase [Streptomyces lincolnensis]|uniref:Short chain dehydrogenase n=1 Tax=Streptomyces lincolnensis TaxID=1915 RepID=A0A1B1MB65_STRLN|nr:oxidoreductase [Streptomyces lincolnensis]ANS65875.1 short chain dehydrogenase [Streptomyces lincolnensis]AXG54362.1 short chain dehydrogenase [Streptomyces lincolnensis]QMV08738.1 SDR family NAD(P)-dependent oxidoreductase [Streptomyces lincolnensis]
MQTASPVALVTGASSGIGRAAALALVGAGFAVVGTSRNAANARPIAGVTFLDLDVASDESVHSLVEEVVERFGRIDVLVNNAGVGAVGAGEESSIDQAKEVFDVNVFGLMRMTNAVLPQMRAQRRGRVVNVSSMLGRIPAPFMAVYAATKHAVEGYAESVDHELREHGVRMLLVEPTYTRTSFEASSMAPDSPVPVYAAQREVARDVLATAVRSADDPDVVAKVIVAAATDAKPKLRYPAGPMAKRVSLLRRIVPSRAFDQQIRKLNRLAA